MIELSDISKKKFAVLKKQMVKNGNYQPHHDNLLSALAVCYEIANKCYKEIAVDGVVKESERGSKSNPAAIILNSMLTQIKGYSIELGLGLTNKEGKSEVKPKQTLINVLKISKAE